MVPADVMDITPLNALIPVLLNVMSPNTAELVAMMLLGKFSVPLTCSVLVGESVLTPMRDPEWLMYNRSVSKARSSVRCRLLLSKGPDIRPTGLGMRLLVVCSIYLL
jgi:hypothetical protein